MKGINFEKLRKIERLKQATLTKYATLFPFEDYASYSKTQDYYFKRYMRLLKLEKRILGLN